MENIETASKSFVVVVYINPAFDRFCVLSMYSSFNLWGHGLHNCYLPLLRSVEVCFRASYFIPLSIPCFKFMKLFPVARCPPSSFGATAYPASCSLHSIPQPPSSVSFLSNSIHSSLCTERSTLSKSLTS